MTRRYEWDPEKARSNLRKHGIDFERARRVFADPFHRSVFDGAEHGEQRWRTTGRIGDFTFVLVAHTLTELDEEGEPVELVRIISARPATRMERKRYESDQNPWT